MKLFLKCIICLPTLITVPAWAHDGKHDVDVHVDIQQILKEAQHEVERALASLPHTPKKAFMGVILGTEKERNSQGVYVLDLSDGGAAQKAGLRQGDVLVAMDGVSLAPDDAGSAAHKLGMALRKYAPGDKVKIDYLRDGQASETSMILGGRPMMNFNIDVESGNESFSLHYDASEEDRPVRKHKSVRVLAADTPRWGELELFELNAQLAEYFGDEQGTLVVFAGDNKLDLRAGDVIIDIDGRKTHSPAQVWRILSSYAKGEALRLEIRRKGGRATLSVTSP